VTHARILVLEDDRTTREAVSEALSRRGHRVDVAETIEAFRALLGAGPASLALMDRHIRGTDALDLVTEVRAAQPALPVLMMSSDATPEAVSAALARGVRSFLAKPFALSTLVATVEEALARRTT
jgi:DNA-binding NtrC family response regulator